MSASGFSHLDERGAARMVDIAAKPVTRRLAEAGGEVSMKAATLALIRSQAFAKGDVLATARLAGLMAAKRVHEWIPLCHPLALTSAQLDFAFCQGEADRAALEVRATCVAVARTGVEMEALTAVAAACLTVYDMCKSVDRDMVIHAVRLLRKSGGRSGDYERSAG